MHIFLKLKQFYILMNDYLIEFAFYKWKIHVFEPVVHMQQGLKETKLYRYSRRNVICLKLAIFVLKTDDKV